MARAGRVKVTPSTALLDGLSNRTASTTAANKKTDTQQTNRKTNNQAPAPTAAGSVAKGGSQGQGQQSAASAAGGAHIPAPLPATPPRPLASHADLGTWVNLSYGVKYIGVISLVPLAGEWYSRRMDRLAHAPYTPASQPHLNMNHTLA